MNFRSGNIGALMDEYERASNDLRNLILSFNEVGFEIIIDKNTNDDDCRSVKSIMNHVIEAGYRYLNQIKAFLGQEKIKPLLDISNISNTIKEFDLMMTLTSETVKNNLYLTDEEVLATRTNTRWGLYDIEMMFEHAIVHILRHRRQIEKLTNH